MARYLKLFNADKPLLFILVVILIGHYSQIVPQKFDDLFLIFFASIASLPVVINVIKSLKNKSISIDLLAGIALFLSLLNKEWASAVFINLMLTSARLLAKYTEDHARSAIKSLLKLRPEKVKIKRGNKIIEESVSKINVGDFIVIELGDRIPVDGIVISGKAIIDQSSLTGESIPVNKEENDKVFSSTLNVSGSLVIKAEKVGSDTTFEKIVKLVEDSEKNKVKIQTTANIFTSFYIVLTILAVLVIYFFTKNLPLVLSVILVTCADDIAVAIPMAFYAAIGTAARKGIIIKGGDYLEMLAKIKTVVFDKTGTITKGKLKVDRVIPMGKFLEGDVIKLAAIADFFSEHPLAKAVIKYADLKSIKYVKPKIFKEFPGKGMIAIFRNKKIIFGKLSFLKEKGIEINKKDIAKIEKNIDEESNNKLFVGYGGEFVGCIFLADQIRPESILVINALRKLGIKNVIMLTGDNEEVAKSVANETRMDSFHSNLLPKDKVEYVRKYLNKEGKLLMVGDGINDAAALALADVGIAMGAIGSDVAIEAADIALMKDDVRRIPETIGLSRYVIKIAKQDFVIWGVINTIGLILVFSKIIGPEGAAAFNFITDFFPILNSFRVFNYKFTKN